MSPDAAGSGSDVDVGALLDARETWSLVLLGDRGAVRAATITAALRLLREHLAPKTR